MKTPLCTLCCTQEHLCVFMYNPSTCAQPSILVHPSCTCGHPLVPVFTQLYLCSHTLYLHIPLVPVLTPCVYASPVSVFTHLYPCSLPVLAHTHLPVLTPFPAHIPCACTHTPFPANPLYLRAPRVPTLALSPSQAPPPSCRGPGRVQLVVGVSPVRPRPRLCSARLRLPRPVPRPPRSSARAQPNPAEPNRTQPSLAEPSPAEPGLAEWSRAKPSPAESPRVEPSRAELSRTASVKSAVRPVRPCSCRRCRRRGRGRPCCGCPPGPRFSASR